MTATRSSHRRVLVGRGLRVINPLEHRMPHAVFMQMTDSQHHDLSTPSTRCLDTEGLGQYLGLSARTIDRLRQSGELPYRRFGYQVRFAPEDVAEFVAKSRVVEGPNT